MSLIDSSAWISYLRDDGSTVAEQVERALRSGDLLTSEPIVLEVLAGARSDQHRSSLQGLLARAALVPVVPADWAEAAFLYRVCRSNGSTVRALFDCLIAAVAIRVRAPVLTSDRDFAALAAHTPLRLAPS